MTCGRTDVYPPKYMMHRRSLLHAALAGSAWSVGLAQASEKFPLRPVRLIVPVPAGQGGDIAARVIATAMAERWGQSVYVDNRAGGAAIPGMVAAKTAPPDGYTMVFGFSSALVVNPALFDKLPYDAMNDFIAVHGVYRNPLVIIASKSSGIQSLQQLVQQAKREPGKLNISYPGIGNTQHLTGELFKHVAGIELTNVFYKGSAQAVTALAAGEVSVGVESTSTVLPLIRDGRIVALAATDLRRIAQLPNVPTVDESGYRNFEGTGFGGIMVPKGTPAEIVERIESTISAVLRELAVQEKFAQLGFVVFAANGMQWTEQIRRETEKWGPVVKQAGIKPQ